MSTAVNIPQFEHKPQVGDLMQFYTADPESGRLTFICGRVVDALTPDGKPQFNDPLPLGITPENCIVVTTPRESSDQL